ncbi:MAG: DUF2384 domain-containing protein [Bacteroidales bacterium]|nr:DUF2384 domain-containing protein [Bacteroidales bacterium]
MTTIYPLENQISEAIAEYVRTNKNIRQSNYATPSKASISNILHNKLLISNLIRSGVPLHLFEMIQSMSPFTEVQWAAFLGISTKTLSRNKQSKLFIFKPLQSERIIAIAEFVLAAFEVFEDEEQFLLWLNSPSYALGNNKPVDLLGDHYGRELVLTELIHIDHGIFA